MCYRDGEGDKGRREFPGICRARRPYEFSESMFLSWQLAFTVFQ